VVECLAQHAAAGLLPRPLAGGKAQEAALVAQRHPPLVKRHHRHPPRGAHGLLQPVDLLLGQSAAGAGGEGIGDGVEAVLQLQGAQQLLAPLGVAVHADLHLRQLGGEVGLAHGHVVAEHLGARLVVAAHAAYAAARLHLHPGDEAVRLHQRAQQPAVLVSAAKSSRGSTSGPTSSARRSGRIGHRGLRRGVVHLDGERLRARPRSRAPAPTRRDAPGRPRGCRRKKTSRKKQVSAGPPRSPSGSVSVADAVSPSRHTALGFVICC
jgi:hypothetical protein